MNHPTCISESGISQRLLRTSLAVVMLAIGATTLTGCASPQPKPSSMRDPQVDFNAYATFGWASIPSDQPLSLLDSTIRSALRTELTHKGYTEATAGASPDLLVSFETAKADTVKSKPMRIGIGVGSYGSSGGGSVGVSSPSAENVTEASLVVHVVDPARKAEVWQSRVVRQMGKGSVDPAFVQKAVTDVLADLPARGAQTPVPK